MTPISSGNIRGIDYSLDTETLTVHFKTGGAIYNYHQVPEKVYKELIDAPSAGSYFYKHIRQNYKFNRQDKK